MVHAVRIHENGGPEVLTWEEITVGEPAAGEVRIQHTAIGLNFIDTYQRSGLYQLPLPAILGQEGAGVVEAVGPNVTTLKIGDRVAYVGILGGYAESRIVPAERTIKLPADISDQQAAAMMLRGLTVQAFLQQTYAVQAGDTILVHAAAGGVGLMMCQWAQHLGATVIGTVSTEEKAALAHANGCTYPLIYGKEDIVARTRDITHGTGVPVVYDSVGKDTFMASIHCLQTRGLMVSFGQSSGAVPPFDISILSKESLYLTRASIFSYIKTRSELEAGAHDLFEVVRSGAVTIAINQSFPLRAAADAHRTLEDRKTTGSTILIP